MEESSESHMETDVSSTTDDVPESQQVISYHGDVETVIVVEEVKEDEDGSIDSKFEQPQGRVSSATVSEGSPQKDRLQKVPASPQKVVVTSQKSTVTPVKETNGPRSLLRAPIQADSQNKEIVPQPSTTQGDIVDSSTKTDAISPSKTPDTNCIKISPIQVNHKSIKPIKLVRSYPTIAPKLTDKTIKIMKEAPPPKVIKIMEIKEANAVDSAKINQSSPIKSATKNTPTKDQTAKESPMPEKQVTGSPIKIVSLQEKSVKNVAVTTEKAQDIIKTKDDLGINNSIKTIANTKVPVTETITGKVTVTDNKTIKNITEETVKTIPPSNLTKTPKTISQETVKTPIKITNQPVKNISNSNDSVTSPKGATAVTVTDKTTKIITSIESKKETKTDTPITSNESPKTVKNVSVSNDTVKTVKSNSEIIKIAKNNSETVTTAKDPIKIDTAVKSSDNEPKAPKSVNKDIKPAKVPKTSVISNPEVAEVIEKDPADVPNTDTPEKEHNKSISRELKSLINSAKESKIISECTQLTSKTRKSRTHVDSPNTSIVEGDKVENRRGSTNSQISNSSEKSDKPPLKRSMRSQNPEFVTKCKQFLNTVTSKVTKEDEVVTEDETEVKEKEKTEHCDSPTPKKKKIQPVQEKMGKLRSDIYCWRCHWTVEQEQNDKAHPPLLCTVCPRSYHYKCLSANERKTSETAKSWVCPDCLLVLSAESSETRSPAMKKTTLGTLCVLLKHALDRMMEINGAEPFLHPVDRTSFPDYDKYIVHPMDLTQMKQNIEDSHYGSTEAFVADVQWILHNSIIFNTCEQAFLQSKLTAGARALVRSCKAEMGEIEACPECYASAHAHKPTWFTDVCTTPHILLWAKLKGFPYWPAKGMTVNSSGLVDVRFFGAHDRAWVPAKDCFLFSEKDPNNFRNKRQDILDSMLEAEQHIRNISRKYGKFVYPPFKTQFEPTQLTQQLKMMIPSFEGEVRMKEKPTAASPAISKEKKRSPSKSSKSSANEGEASENDDTSSKDAPTSEKENSSEKDKPMEVDTQVEATPTRKRRRSNLDEALTVPINSSTSEKRKKVENIEQKKPEPQQASNKVEKKNDPEDAKKKTDTPKSKSKEEESASTLEERETQRVTPIKLVALPRPNKQTPKMFITKASPKPSTPKEDDKTPQKTKVLRSDKTPTSEKVKELKEREKGQGEKRRNSRSKSASSTPKVAKPVEKRTESEASSSKEGNKDVKQKENEVVKDKGNTSKTVEISKPMKDRINFDDDTILAVIARKTRQSGMPTISNVCSLSTTAQNSLTTNTQTTTAAKSMEVTIEANSDSSIFIPTSTDNVRNMQDAVTKLQKLRETEPLVGRVGVKAFARMTSPPRTDDNVQVEIKAEPVDLEESDETRHNEKMDLMNACKLRPVNQPPNLRDVRINRVVVPSFVVKKTGKQESRPRAKKTFPQPRRTEDNRSELNGKNTMVYIPIQPPMTPGPVRGPRPVQHIIRPTAPASGNKAVNTVTTPLKLTTSTISSPTIIPPITTVSGQSTVSGQASASGQVVGSIAQVPTVGQVPTTVHTVPLMTSVNGQWMLSLQPVMSVGGVDGGQTSIVNGISDRSTPALIPIAASLSSTPSTPTQAKTTTSSNSNTSTPNEMPRLQQRPLAHPLDPSAVTVVPPPSTAGPITAKLTQNAVKLADFFRTLMEETIDRFEEPAAVATSIRLQLEHLKWRHQQELDEIRHNHELSVSEMRLSFEKEKMRAVAEARRVCSQELDAAVKIAKSKQWCVNCNHEAQLYCCWNTAYCDYPCQRAHWPVHFNVCAQIHNDGNEDSGSSPTESRLPQPDNLPSLQKSAPPATPPFTANDKLARLAPAADTASTQPQKTSIIVSMVEDNSGNQTMKCVGTYKSNQNQTQISPLILNKQVLDETGKKVVTSGGYLIVGATSNASSVATPATTRRSHIQYFT